MANTSFVPTPEPVHRFLSSQRRRGTTRRWAYQYIEIIAKAEERVRWAESMTRGGRKGAPKARADGATHYAAEIKSFLFYLRSGTQPGSGSFQMYRPIVESLVASGEFRPEALNSFNRFSSS